MNFFFCFNLENVSQMSDLFYAIFYIHLTMCACNKFRFYCLPVFEQPHFSLPCCILYYNPMTCVSWNIARDCTFQIFMLCVTNFHNSLLSDLCCLSVIAFFFSYSDTVTKKCIKLYYQIVQFIQKFQ